MLGAIIGDIAGSIYEFDNHRSKDFQFFGRGASFTDDTVCTVAVADMLLNGGKPAHVLRGWCRRYPNRGYGGMFAQWIDDASMGPYGSYGNGAAMRASPAGLLASTIEDAAGLADRVTEVTHNHAEGMKGARATAVAIRMAREGRAATAIRAEVASRFGYDLSRSVDDIRPDYHFNETCQETVPEALTCALEAKDFEDAIRNAISIGGDSDTVAAIAGGIAEALFGIPDELARDALSRLPDDMKRVIRKLYAAEGRSAT